MPTRRRLLALPAALWTATLPALLPPCAHAATSPVDLTRPNVVVVLRHARAPGVGDPAGFRRDDCATQRNLSAGGREQARKLGERWKAAGFRPTQVLSSAWCRCQDTARLIGLGPVRVEPMLNSFFGSDAAARDAQIKRLSRYIDQLDPRGGPYLLVTHQVVVTALTGHDADSGGGVTIELPVAGQARRVTVLPAPEVAD